MFWPKGQQPETEPSSAAEPKIGRRAKAAQAASGKQPLSGAQLAQRGLASTVVIRCDESLGSGFFVANDRILTNAHVVCPENETLHIRSSDGRQGTGKTLRVSEELDLALIQAEGLQGVALPLGDAGALQVGDPVVVVGAPKGMEFSVTQGGVSNLDRVSLGVAYLQTDAAINPGNSGGPMLDQQGRVVGVVSMKRTDAEGISLALPINYAFTSSDAMLAFSLPEGSPGFERMLAVAAASDKQEVASLAATGQRPGLIGAEVAGSFIKATILWPSTFDPRQQRFRFVLWHKRDRLCSIDGDVATWRKVEGEEGKSPLPPQGRLWLERNGFSSNLYATATLLNYSTCPLGSLGPGSTVDLEMEGADSDASRIRL
jgi:serine protease Do